MSACAETSMRKILSSLTDGRGFDIGLVGFPLAFLFVMSGLPLLYNVLMSFQEVDMFSLGAFFRPFVGFNGKPGRSLPIPRSSWSPRSLDNS
jgi:multiple sugar transport system permease protein